MGRFAGGTPNRQAISASIPARLASKGSRLASGKSARQTRGPTVRESVQPARARPAIPPANSSSIAARPAPKGRIEEARGNALGVLHKLL